MRRGIIDVLGFRYLRRGEGGSFYRRVCTKMVVYLREVTNTFHCERMMWKLMEPILVMIQHVGATLNDVYYHA